MPATTKGLLLTPPGTLTPYWRGQRVGRSAVANADAVVIVVDGRQPGIEAAAPDHWDSI